MKSRGEEFGPYGPNHGLIVVDMQERMLLYGDEKRPSTDMIRLVRKIEEDVRECSKKGGPIVLVEYLGYGETLPDIKKAAQEHHIQILSKNRWGLFHEKDPGFNEQVKYFLGGGGAGVKFTIGGVSTTVCCLDTAISLLRHNISVRIKAGITLNPGHRSNNELRNIERYYKSHAGLLYLPGDKHKENLIDYL